MWVSSASPTHNGNERRDITPPMCYDPCNGAWTIAYDVGKDEALCDEDGEFMRAYHDCSTCIDANTNSTRVPTRDYVEPKFAEFLEFCDIELLTTTITVSLDNGTPLTTVTYIFEVNNTNLGPTSGTSTPTSQITSTTASNGSRNGPLETGTGDGTDGTDSAGNSWIAGPVVGSIAGLALIFGLAFWLWRRRRSRAAVPPSTQPDEHLEKAQLHGDSMKLPEPIRAELHPDSVHEMEGSAFFEVSSTSNPSEKPANEAVAHEMAAEKMDRQR